MIYTAHSQNTRLIYFYFLYWNLIVNVKMFMRGTRNFSLKIGDRVSIKRKITAEDVKVFSDVTRDHNPIHSDPNVKIVHGAFLNGLVSGVIGTSLPGAGTVVVHQSLRFPKPCYVGSEVTIDVEVKSVRKLIEVDFQVYSGEDSEEKIFLEGSAKLLLPFEEGSNKFVNSYGHDYTKN